MTTLIYAKPTISSGIVVMNAVQSGQRKSDPVHVEGACLKDFTVNSYEADE